MQTKFRDEPRSRGGLIRVREFTMKDSYSLDADWEGLDKQYRAHYQAYFNIFHRCHLPVIAVQSDVGMMGGQMAHEYMYLTTIGEYTLVLCDACGYAANRRWRRCTNQLQHQDAAAIERVATPGTSTIDDLADILVLTSLTAKAVFYMATVADPVDANATRQQFILRYPGDTDLNETKLTNAIAAREPTGP
jgi:prolyl-tRNA synthetase